MEVEHGLNFFSEEAGLFSTEITRTKYIPEQLLERYIRAATKRVTVKHLESNTFFLEIPGFDGVWASGDQLAECALELREVLLDWLVLKIEQNDRDLPIVDDISLNAI